MSAIVLAPRAAIDWRSAPTRFCVPSVTCDGPLRIWSSGPDVPTRIRVPRGRTGDGAAMPQLVPLSGRLGGTGERRAEHHDVRAGSDGLGDVAALLHAAVGDDGNVASGLCQIQVTGRGDVGDGGDLGDPDAQHLTGRACGARADTHEDGGCALLHEQVGRLGVGRVADGDRDRHEPREVKERQWLVAGREVAGRRDLRLEEEQVRALLRAERAVAAGDTRRRGERSRGACGVQLLDPAGDQRLADGGPVGLGEDVLDLPVGGRDDPVQDLCRVVVAELDALEVEDRETAEAGQLP